MSKKSNFQLLSLASERARKTTSDELGSHFYHFLALSNFFLKKYLEKIFDKKKGNRNTKYLEKIFDEKKGKPKHKLGVTTF